MTKKYDIFSEYDKKAIRKFAKKCLNLRNAIFVDTTVLTPINYHQERERFFNSPGYNPQFLYRKVFPKHVEKHIESARKQLQTLKLPDDLAHHFAQYITSVELLSQTIEEIGKDRFSSCTQELFHISAFNAHEVLQTLPKISFHEEEKNRLHTAEEIARTFHEYLQNYEELYNYRIYLDTFNDHTIRVGEKRLIIGSKVKRTTSNVRRLIVHEIETHILQRYNSKISKNPLVKLIQAGEQEIFGEGLAVFNEIYTKTITKKAYNTYFYRLKAVEMLNCSFREIFDYLTNVVTPHQAFIITTRVKRGLSDTSQPGGFPKDAAYLLGYDRVNRYVNTGGDLPFLYIVRHPEYGKILAKYNLLTPGDYVLPKFLQKKPLMEQLRNEFMAN